MANSYDTGRTALQERQRYEQELNSLPDWHKFQSDKAKLLSQTNQLKARIGPLEAAVQRQQVLTNLSSFILRLYKEGKMRENMERRTACAKEGGLGRGRKGGRKRRHTEGGCVKGGSNFACPTLALEMRRQHLCKICFARPFC